MPSFYIPLSGLNADSTALNTIANNLANMNTTGFKAQTTKFSDLFYQQVGTNGAGNEIQAGTGVQVASNSTDYSGGSIASTGVSTDVAINGVGFFVLDGGTGSQLYSRNGSFQVSPSGVLESSAGLPVMGYSASAGVVNSSGGLSDIIIPTGTVMSPSATSNFGMTQNLNSESPIGTKATGQVQIFDSLGKTYEATVTYINQGSNTWSYDITLPNVLTPSTAAAATISNALTQNSASASGTTTLSYSFSTNAGKLATVDPSTSLVITGPLTAGGTGSITAPPIIANESVTKYAADLTAALATAGMATGVGGVSVTANAAGLLSISGPTATLSTTGIVNQDLPGSTVNYSFGASGVNLATVDPGTNLTLTGPTASGGTATITAPAVTAGETVASYVTALNAALTTAGITGVTVSGPSAAGVVSVTSLGTTGSVIQEPVASANTSGTLVFDSSGNLLTPASNVSGLTFAGLSDSAATMSLTWDLFGAGGTGNVSQTAAASSTSTTHQNGYTSGQYQSFAIDGTGTIAATYSNGQTQNVGQLAIATVSNEQGLVNLGSSEYKATSTSGSAAVGQAGSGGRGTINGASLEASNVNISAEFSALIVAQRAFEANSKAVTTFDSVTQETINMIH